MRLNLMFLAVLLHIYAEKCEIYGHLFCIIKKFN